MNPPLSFTTLRRRLVSSALLLGLCACASQERATNRLPFHIALAPTPIVPDGTTRSLPGNPTELALAFDAKRLAAQLESTLGANFVKVTVLPPATDAAGADPSGKGLVAGAEQAGADLLIVPSLRFDPRVQTELNGQFWLNLPLFALGGPFCWFVPDRSYHCYARLEGDIHDVAAAAARNRQKLDSSTRMLRVSCESREASLSFLQRASGADHYLLSVICPAGLLATESSSIPAELDAVVVATLCDQLSGRVNDNDTLVLEGDLVDFFPRDCRVVVDANGRSLVGEFVLKTQDVGELGNLRYRSGGTTAWRDAAWLPVRADGATDRKVYPFALRLDGTTGTTVQLMVEQRDNNLSKRTFTFPVTPTSKS
ncbi:MAG: hypothetical protein U1F60_05390 [Planctomycetota bacterium]